MKKRIIFDIDGVVRDLGIVFRRFNIPSNTDWFWKYKGKDIYWWVNKDISILEEAPPTEYLNTIKLFKNKSKIEFWSHQPIGWRKYTVNWLKKYFGNNYKIRYLKPEQKFKRLQKYKNLILIDDYPFFPNYDRIILISRPYNTFTKPKIRVNNIEELKTYLLKNEL